MPDSEEWDPWANCTPACAQPVRCSVCGNTLPPRGRSIGYWIPDCCDAERMTARNTCHIWPSEVPATEETP